MPNSGRLLFGLLIAACGWNVNALAAEKSAAGGGSVTSISRVETYKVYKIENGVEKLIGTVHYTDYGRLSLSEAKPLEQKFLEELIEEMNSKEALHVEAPAPAGSPQFAQASRSVKKGEPGYFAALSDYLLKYHDVKLKPAGKSKARKP